MVFSSHTATTNGRRERKRFCVTVTAEILHVTAFIRETVINFSLVLLDDDQFYALHNVERHYHIVRRLWEVIVINDLPQIYGICRSLTRLNRKRIRFSYFSM